MPTRQETKKRLEQMAAAARLLREGLSEVSEDAPVFQIWPDGGGIAVLSHAQQLCGNLDDIARRIEERVNDLSGGGRGRARGQTFRHDSAKELCAGHIYWIWARLYEVEPRVTKNSVQNACEMLWKAAGGASPGHFGNTDAGWRKPLEWARDNWNKGEERWLVVQELRGLRPDSN